MPMGKRTQIEVDNLDVTIGNVDVNPPTILVTVNATVAGGPSAATPFVANALVRGGVLKAPVANTSDVYVGAGNVDSATLIGLPLSPGESVGVDIDNTSDIFISGATNGDIIHFTGG